MRICGLNNGGNLVRILVCRGVMVRSLRIGCILASKVSSEAAWVYGINLVEYIRYKASDPIEFGRGKEFIGFFGLV